GSSANAKRAVVRARKEVHVDGAMRLATPDCRGILKLQTEDRLPDGGAAVACAGWSSHYRVIRTTVLFGVHEGIEQRHPGEADHALLGSFYFGLCLFFHTVLDDFQALLRCELGQSFGGLRRRRGGCGSVDLIGEFADLFGELAVLLLQPVQTF